MPCERGLFLSDKRRRIGPVEKNLDYSGHLRILHKKAKMAKRKPNKQKTTTSSSSDDGKVRLQKLLAAHGKGSRRACEEFIVDGRVTVDGQVVKKLGTKVNPEKQKVALDGERLVEQRLQYFMLNKPPGVVSTAQDPSGRLRVIDLIKTNTRVYNVGRLDKSSEGLILVTNDGDLANRLTHPRYGVEKKYHVLVKGRPSFEKLDSLKQGVYLAEAKVQVKNVRVKKRLREGTWLEIILDEGRNREIRRLLARVGHKVVQLRRVAIGPLLLDDLPIGMHRRLTLTEVKRLQKATAETQQKPRKKRVIKKKSSKKATSRKRSSTPGSRTRASTKKSTRGKAAGRKTTGRKTASKKTSRSSRSKAPGGRRATGGRTAASSSRGGRKMSKRR